MISHLLSLGNNEQNDDRRQRESNLLGLTVTREEKNITIIT